MACVLLQNNVYQVGSLNIGGSAKRVDWDLNDLCMKASATGFSTPPGAYLDPLKPTTDSLVVGSQILSWGKKPADKGASQWKWYIENNTSTAQQIFVIAPFKFNYKYAPEYLGEPAKITPVGSTPVPVVRLHTGTGSYIPPGASVGLPSTYTCISFRMVPLGRYVITLDKPAAPAASYRRSPVPAGYVNTLNSVDFGGLSILHDTSGRVFTGIQLDAETQQRYSRRPSDGALVFEGVNDPAPAPVATLFSNGINSARIKEYVSPITKRPGSPNVAPRQNWGHTFRWDGPSGYRLYVTRRAGGVGAMASKDFSILRNDTSTVLSNVGSNSQIGPIALQQGVNYTVSYVADPYMVELWETRRLPVDAPDNVAVAELVSTGRISSDIDYDIYP